MFSKSFIAPIFFLALTSSINVHAVVAPALGVKGNPARSDVQRPSQAKPCGNIDIAQNLDTSTAVNEMKTEAFPLTLLTLIREYIVRAHLLERISHLIGMSSVLFMVHDRSRLVDASGTGTNFVPARILTNGDPVHPFR